MKKGKSKKQPRPNVGLRTKWSSLSIAWKLVLPVPVALGLTVIGIWVALPNIIAQNVRADAVQSGQQTANQFKTIRGYYTRNVIQKVVKSGALKPSFNHENEENGVPLPATFIHDLSALLAEADTSINLFSGFPFPVRGDRQLDGFQEEAWAFLSANPDETFVRQEERDGVSVVRVAVADRMVAQGCVDCHNSHAASPKTDWKLGDVRGVLEVASVIEGQLARGAALSTKLGVFAAVLGVILSALTVLAARGVSRPLGGMTNAMKKLAGGDNSIVIPGLDRSDELGAMAGTVQVFKENAFHGEQLAREREKEGAIKEERARRIDTLSAEFNDGAMSMLDSVSAASTEMQASAESMAATAQQTSQRSSTVAAASEDATSNVQTVASATEELTSSISEIGRQVSQSAEIAGAAVGESERMNTEVQGLNDAAQKIGEVVDLINDIASQTNLLALNATIEAARAGEAGKGFAVVASEVKSLANQTAKATEEIGAQISSMQGATTSAVQVIAEIGERIAQISEIANSIASAVQEQTTATQEIARNVQEAARGTEEVSSTISGVNSAAEETGQSASQVLAATAELSQQSESLRSEVQKFLSEVRAA